MIPKHKTADAFASQRDYALQGHPHLLPVVETSTYLRQEFVMKPIAPPFLGWNVLICEVLNFSVLPADPGYITSGVVFLHGQVCSVSYAELSHPVEQLTAL